MDTQKQNQKNRQKKMIAIRFCIRNCAIDGESIPLYFRLSRGLCFPASQAPVLLTGDLYRYFSILLLLLLYTYLMATANPSPDISVNAWFNARHFDASAGLER